MVTLKIKIKDEEHEVTISEAQRIYEELDAIFGRNRGFDYPLPVVPKEISPWPNVPIYPGSPYTPWCGDDESQIPEVLCNALETLFSTGKRRATDTFEENSGKMRKK